MEDKELWLTLGSGEGSSQPHLPAETIKTLLPPPPTQGKKNKTNTTVLSEGLHILSHFNKIA